MTLTTDEYNTIGSAISIIYKPTTRYARDNKQAVMKKLVKIMEKYMPEEDN